MKNKKVIRSNQNFSSSMGIGLPISRNSSSKGGFRFLPYSGDSVVYNTYNIYPQILSKLVYDSPTQGAAITRKQFMMKGEGFDMDLWTEGFKTSMESLNSNFETANDILDKLSWDYSTFNGFALKVCWGNDGLIKELYHIPFTEVRVGNPNSEGKVENYIVSNNWDGLLTNSLEYVEKYPVFNPEFFKDGVPLQSVEENGINYNVPNPSEIQSEQAEQIIYYWKYKPYSGSTNNYYPTPDYSGCLDSVLTEISAIISNKAKMKNGLGGKTLVILPNTNQQEEAKAEFQANFEANFSGVENDGAIIIEYADNPEQVNITQLDAIDADTYKNVADSAKNDIITGHLIPAILLEVNNSGGFNNRGVEMNEAFNIYQKTIIKDKQNDICRVFKTLALWFGFPNENVNIIPFSLIETTQNSDGKTSLTSN